MNRKVLFLVLLLLGVALLYHTHRIEAHQTMNVSPGSTAIAYLSGVTGSTGGSLLTLGGTSSSGTASVTGASPGMPCEAQPSDGTNMWLLGVMIGCTVTSSNTVTVNLNSLLTVTPAAKTYNVRVFP